MVGDNCVLHSVAESELIRVFKTLQRWWEPHIMSSILYLTGRNGLIWGSIHADMLTKTHEDWGLLESTALLAGHPFQ